MAFTGYSNSGSTYEVGSERGMNFINSATSGSRLTGGDGSSWLKNNDGSTSISKNGETWTVGNPLSNLQNSLDEITRSASSSSARNLEYARQQQDWSANQAAIANSFNAAEAAKNREWQQYMSNTAHQREVADLKKAGLNPVLSAMGGNGAPVTSGAAANANLPSGASASGYDTSGSIVQLLSSMLAAQTQLTNTAVSAKTQEAVADKYTAMSQITAEIAAAASRYGAQSSAAASMYGSDKQYQIQQDFPSSMVRILDSMLSGTDYGWSDIGGQIMKTALEVYDKWEKDNPTFWETLAGKLKSGYGTAKEWLDKQIHIFKNKTSGRLDSGSGRKF